jgi:hypothetical protein
MLARKQVSKIQPARYISSVVPRAKIPNISNTSKLASRICPPSSRFYASQARLLPTQITTLDNKIRVATEATPGHFSAVGVYIDAGSRYEAPQFSGVSHILDRMAFKVSRIPKYVQYSCLILDVFDFSCDFEDRIC